MFPPKMHKYCMCHYSAAAAWHDCVDDTHRALMTNTRTDHCFINMTLCKLCTPSFNRHGAGFALSCNLSKITLCEPSCLTCWWTLSWGTCIQSEQKEPIKPEPGPHFPSHASVGGYQFGALPWAASDLKISWSFAAVILTSKVHSLGFPLLRNWVSRDKGLLRTAHGKEERRLFWDLL